MPFERDYRDSTPKDNTDNWKPIGDVAAQLAAKLDRALVAGNSEVAETYHSLWFEAEYDL